MARDPELEDVTLREGRFLSKEMTFRPLAQRAAAGVIWMLGQSVAGRISLLLSQLILARLLQPSDFGTIALASTVSASVMALANFGIDEILQQRRGAAHLWVTQVFLIGLGIGVLSMLVLLGCAPLAAHLYRNPRLTGVIIIASLSIPIQAIAIVPQAQLQAQLRYGIIARLNILDVVTTQSVTILLAILGFGPYSFVLPPLIVVPVRVFLTWRLAKPRLRPIRRARGWSFIANRAGANFISRFAVTLINQGDFVTLGLLASNTEVGLYYFAFRLAAQPMTMVAANVQGVLFSTLTRNNTQSLRVSQSLKSASLVGLIAVPTCYLIAATAESWLGIFFGARWLPALPYLKALSLGVPFDAISWPAGALLAAQGQFKRAAIYQSISVPFFFLSVVAGYHAHGGVGVAGGVAVYYFVHPLVYCLATFLPAGVSLRKIFGLFGRPLLVGSGGWLAATYVSVSLNHEHLSSLVIGLLLGAILVFVLLHVVAGSEIGFVRRQIFNLMSKRAN